MHEKKHNNSNYKKTNTGIEMSLSKSSGYPKSSAVAIGEQLIADQGMSKIIDDKEKAMPYDYETAYGSDSMKAHMASYVEAAQAEMQKMQEARYDTIRYDTIRYDTIRYDTIRYDTIR
jgi:hypothetical protein